MKKHYSVLLIIKKDAECMSHLVYVYYDDLARQSRIFYGIHVNITLSLCSLVTISRYS